MNKRGEERGAGKTFLKKSFPRPFQKTLTREQLLSGRFSQISTLPVTASDPRMIDVSQKLVTYRMARARALVRLTKEIMALLENGDIHSKKGPVFQAAIIAGVLGAKKTSELIPFCHPLGLEDCKIKIDTDFKKKLAIIECSVSLHHKTGVEMEALMGASVAALTIYDMCKAMSHDIVIEEVRLLEKTGGKKDFCHDR